MLSARYHFIYVTVRDGVGHVVPAPGSFSLHQQSLLLRPVCPTSIAQHLYIIPAAAVHLSVRRISLPSLSPMTSKSSLLLL